MTQRGFTFIEVLVAMMIFTLAVVTALSITGGSVQATRDTKETSIATSLLQRVIVELESKVETQGFDKACEKKKEGKFDAPYEAYSFVTYCDEIDFPISETAAAVEAEDPNKDDKTEKEDVVKKIILQVASDYIAKSIRELHVEVKWMRGKQERVISATTHVARYDQPITLPSLGQGS